MWSLWHAKGNADEKAAKEQVVKYETMEFTGLDRTGGEMTAERDGVVEEPNAVNDYSASVDKKYIVKVESYVWPPSKFRTVQVLKCSWRL